MLRDSRCAFLSTSLLLSNNPTTIIQHHHSSKQLHLFQAAEVTPSFRRNYRCLVLDRMQQPTKTSIAESTALFSNENNDFNIENGDVTHEDYPNVDQDIDQKETNDIKKDNEDSNDIPGKILSIAIPALLGLAIDPLMTLVDTAFIGKTSTSADALAGVGSASGLLTFSFYMFSFLTTVTTPLVSERRAAGNESGAITIGGQALSLACVLGGTLSLVLLIFTQPLLNVMGAQEIGTEATQYALSFAQIRSLAAPAIFMSSASTGILRGYLDTKSAFFILFATNIINFTLDVILISIAGLGPTGAAIATTSAEWLACLSFLGILAGILPSADGKLGSNQNRKNDLDENQPLLSKSNESVDAKRYGMVVMKPIFSVPSWETIEPLIVASSASFLRSFSLQLFIAGAAAMAARSGSQNIEIGAASIAAHQIALQLWLLCSFICDALAAASQALVADAIGRSNKDEVRNVCNVIILSSLVLGVVLASLLFLGNTLGLILSVFTNDVATQEALKPILYILILSQPLNAYVFASDGIMQGASEFTYEAKSMFVSVLAAVGCFLLLDASGADRLSNVWLSLTSLMFMRGLTASYKICQPDGPINLLSLRSSFGLK